MTAELPIHFFTIVLNGEPFIRHHIEIFRRLRVPWHWHIVEGVAELKHDTAWSLQFGGKITDQLHRNGLSNDGTTEYLDGLRAELPNNITIYRKPAGLFFDGKLEMVNAPLANIISECLLWQVDSDELWTAEQIAAAHGLFASNPRKTAGYFSCHYMVGPALLITSQNTYGNHREYEWLRLWRFKPGMRWLAHEPPRLGQIGRDGKWQDLAELDPFRHADTEPRGLIFQHFAYATEQQLQFKEFYYGYKDAVAQWKTLQQQTEFPLLLRNYFHWVKDKARVEPVESRDIRLLARRNILGDWRFRAAARKPEAPERILWIRIDAIGDNVLAASMLPHIREKFGFAEITVLCREHVVELYESCPFVDGVIGVDHKRFEKERGYRKQIASHLKAKRFDLALNSTYSRNDVADILADLSGAREKVAIESDLSNFDAQVRDKGNALYDRILKTARNPGPELERHRDFLRGLEISAEELKPRVWCTAEDEAWANEFFRENQVSSIRTLALFPQSQLEAKDYPHFADVLKEFKEYDVIVFAKNETPAIKALVSAVPNRVFNLVGRTTLRQMAACLRRCSLYMGVDSAGAHLACAVGLPNVVVVGGGHFGRFLPYSPLTSIVSLPLDCFGCNWECRFSQVHCIGDIPPQVVVAAIRKTLDDPSDKPRIFFPQFPGDRHPQPGEPAVVALDSRMPLGRVDLCPISATPNPRKPLAAANSTAGFGERLRRWMGIAIQGQARK